MRKIVHKLRQKPEEERRHILHIALFLAAIILIALWIFSLGKSISSNETKIKIKQDLKPFSILKDSVTGDTPSPENQTSEIE